MTRRTDVLAVSVRLSRLRYLDAGFVYLVKTTQGFYRVLWSLSDTSRRDAMFIESPSPMITAAHLWAQDDWLRS
jgi:hypothetical protein